MLSGSSSRHLPDQPDRKISVAIKHPPQDGIWTRSRWSMVGAGWVRNYRRIYLHQVWLAMRGCELSFSCPLRVFRDCLVLSSPFWSPPLWRIRTFAVVVIRGTYNALSTRGYGVSPLAFNELFFNLGRLTLGFYFTFYSAAACNDSLSMPAIQWFEFWD